MTAAIEVMGETYYPVLEYGRPVRHACGGHLYHTGHNGWRYCRGCRRYLPWPAENGRDNRPAASPPPR